MQKDYYQFYHLIPDDLPAKTDLMRVSMILPDPDHPVPDLKSPQARTPELLQSMTRLTTSCRKVSNQFR